MSSIDRMFQQLRSEGQFERTGDAFESGVRADELDRRLGTGDEAVDDRPVPAGGDEADPHAVGT